MIIGTNLEIYFPPVIGSSCILYYVLDTLLSLLPLEDIVRLVAAVLLDGQILVVGSSLKEVSHCVLALQLLARPFTFCGPVIPILPSSPLFLRLLDSPTPFLIGVAPTPELREVQFLESCIFVHLDRQFVGPSATPCYPRQKGVLQKVQRLLAREKSQMPHPFGFPTVFRLHANHKFSFSQTTSDLVAAAFGDPLTQLFGDEVCGFFVTDNTTRRKEGGVTVFNAELFLAQSNPDDYPFLKEFLESQNFEMYIAAKMTQFLAAKVGGGSAAVANSSPDRSGCRKRTKPIERHNSHLVSKL
jgi:hypothetical protein